MESNKPPIVSNNHGERLTREDLDSIRALVSGMHFAKESFAEDKLMTRLFYAAEALLREVDILHETRPTPEMDSM